jgi:transposase
VVVSALESASREELLSLIGLLQRQVSALEEQNAELAAANERLTARMAELERRLGRNSGNSSLPPSSDRFTRPEKKQGPTSRRNRGKQPGAPGAGLAMIADVPAVDHRPPECGGCGSDLSGAVSVGFTRRQVHDIPLVTVSVVEHRLHTLRCGCGYLTCAPLPQEMADAPASYGPNLRALATYLLVFQHVPVQRCAQLRADVTGAQVSTGWVCGILEQAAELVEDSVRLIKALLVLGHLLHADETTTRIGARRRWLHVACTERLTFLGLAPRSRAGADSLGVLTGFRGTIVHDSLSLYAGYTQAAHQICGAHLIRELTAAEADHPRQKWPQQLRWALAGLNRQAIRARQDGRDHIPPESAAFYLRHYHQGVAVGLSLHPRAAGRKQTPTRNLLERLRDKTCDILRFADDPLHVPMTNNTGERALRPVKTQVKISGCHQSEQGAAAWLAVRSYLDSARKHGISVFDAIRRAFTANLWMPPIATT